MSELDDRAIAVLMAVVKDYIDTSAPVGSRTVAKRCGLGLSPATIRNIMADLEELGYLQHPHTSAGRCPTEKGYRRYVDSCSSVEAKTEQPSPLMIVNDVRGRLENLERDATTLLEDIAEEVSQLSHHVGLATAPGLAVAKLSRLELVRLRDTRALVVMISEEGIVRNMVVDLEEHLSQERLDMISQFVNREFRGSTVEEARKRLVREVFEDKAVCDSIMAKVIAVCRSIGQGTGGGEVYVGGRAEVLDHPEFTDLQKVRDIYRAIEDKRRMLTLLSKMDEFEGVRVLIGSENQVEGIRDCSLVASSYRRGDRVLGTIGVIGPTRMKYPEVMSIVEETAKWLTQLFSEGRGKPE